MRNIKYAAGLALCFWPLIASAEPTKLKFAFSGSDQQAIYVDIVKPFIAAVNAEAKGVVEIVAYPGGALGKDFANQLKLVKDDTADFAFIVPAYTPDAFPDNALIELPGLFRDSREATLAFTHLVGRLRGYEDLFVVGAFASEPEIINTRPPVASLNDLKGKRIRVNNPGEAAALQKLGMVPVDQTLASAAEAIAAGKLDGTLAPPSVLVEFGVSRLTSNHYLLGISAAPLALVMNRGVFERLPAAAQDTIRKYSGDWTAPLYYENNEVHSKAVLDQLRGSSGRKLVQPSPADAAQAQAAFDSVASDWAKTDPRYPALLAAMRSEIAAMRVGQ